MENEIITPLTDEEIKTGIAHKVAEAVRARLDQYGPIFGKSFPKFCCIGSLQLTLDNFGLTYESTHKIEVGEMPEGEGYTIADIKVEIPETPPNVFRRETEQGVPVMVSENGKTVERAVLYQAKRGRPPRGER